MFNCCGKEMKSLCEQLECKAKETPNGTIWQRVQGREWTITVRDFSPEKAQQVRAIEGVEHVSVADLGLEELFKDFIRGQRVAQ